jgi:hypothetical protein
MSINSLVKELKDNNSDFEFYSTTSDMIKVIANDYIKTFIEYGTLKNFSMMDIGAGNGNVFTLFETYLPKPKDQYDNQAIITKYAIEKSQILINNMPDDIMVVGTDFMFQTLIDKQVDIIFCNPPYKQFKEWMIKIIREANCKVIYFVVPERWKNDDEIINAIETRLGLKEYKKLFDDDHKYINKYEVIGTDSFIDSEYRASRANIDIIKITFNKNRENDPFDAWFEDNFKINAKQEKQNISEYQENKSKSEKIKELVKGNNLIETLENLYQTDLNKLLNTYKALENIDYDLFKEMGVDLGNLKKSLKQKIKNLKVLYWNELFNNLDKITNKLTSISRKKLLDKLQKNTNIDFTASNAYAIIIWVLKNANVYIDEQLKYIYFEMAEKENIINYKSNKVWIEDDWRYRQTKKDLKCFKLDYRLVLNRYRCFSPDKYSTYDYPNGLHIDTHTFINDLGTIANNLGFENIDSSFSFNWAPGVEHTFYYNDAKSHEFMRIRAYKNGNIHVKFNTEFIKKLNIEMARINKWVKDETECAAELDIPVEDVKQYMGSNKKLLPSNIKLLTDNVNNL